MREFGSQILNRNLFLFLNLINLLIRRNIMRHQIYGVFLYKDFVLNRNI